MLDGGGAHGSDLYGDRHLSDQFGSRFGRLSSRTFSAPQLLSEPRTSSARHRRRRSRAGHAANLRALLTGGHPTPAAREGLAARLLARRRGHVRDAIVGLPCSTLGD